MHNLKYPEIVAALGFGSQVKLVQKIFKNVKSGGSSCLVDCSISMKLSSKRGVMLIL